MAPLCQIFILKIKGDSMGDLHTLIMVLKLCGILGMQGDLQPSDAFNCRQAEKFVVEYHFTRDFTF